MDSQVLVYKIYVIPLEKVITKLWAIWNHKNNIIFCNHKCSPIYVLEMAKKIFHNTFLYNKDTNMNNQENIVGFIDINAGKIYKVKHKDPLL